MTNINNKPKKTAKQLIDKMENDKGITFNYMNKTDAEFYLHTTNNYLRTASYRKNYLKYNKGKFKGKYIDLDFSYLTELSTIDMYYRFIIQKMCSDIEHSICVKLISDIELNTSTDGYDIVKTFLTNHPYELKNIEALSNSPHTGDLLKKYFTIDDNTNKIINYDDCPVWVLMELLSFGGIINFYLYYYKNKNITYIPKNILNLVRSLRNAAAHNNCILFDLNKKTTISTQLINSVVSNITSISKSQRQKRLSSRTILEFVSLIYVYNELVDGKVKFYRTEELKKLFNIRMIEKKDILKKMTF